MFTARAVTTQCYRSSDHQLHLIKISKEVKCMRGRGCQKPSMKMSQQLCFYFRYFLLYSALSQLRTPGISCSISPRVCPATERLSPTHPNRPRCLRGCTLVSVTPCRTCWEPHACSCSDGAAASTSAGYGEAAPQHLWVTSADAFGSGLQRWGSIQGKTRE